VSSTVLVVANSTDPDAGYVGERLVARGLTLRPVLRDRAEVPSDVPLGVAAVLLLGSAWSVAAPARPELLDAECALVRSGLERGVATLGLCYGAQVAAHALGGRVAKAAAPEVGLVRIDSTDHDLVPPGPWWAFHTDEIAPPAGAEVLARNAWGVQAFRVPGVLGVQFHPEVRPTTLHGWLGRYPDMLEAAGGDRAAVVEQARLREVAARRNAHALVDAFLTRVAAGATWSDPPSAATP
jgi:GMP synthase-like glutamine amidotransferase